MHQELNIQSLAERLSSMETLLRNAIAAIPTVPGEELNDWASSKQIKQLTGLGNTTLLKLRKENKITYSTIEGKGVWYRKSDFVNLLNKNELKRK